MIGRPSHDVDALARRLPRREPGADRSAVMRSAVLEAAAATLDAPPRAWSRGWRLGGLAAAAAAVCVWLVVRSADTQGPIASTATPSTSGGTSGGNEPRAAAQDAATAPRAPVAAPRAPEAAQAHPPGTGSGDPALAAIAPEQLPDGVSSFVAQRPLLVTRGTATITAPPDARFEVEVRGNEVRHVTVTAGWVVVASGHARTTVVPARYTWTPDAPAPRPTATVPPSTPPPPLGSPNPPPPVRPSSPPPPPVGSPRMAELLAPPPPAERRAPVLPPLGSPRVSNGVSNDVSSAASSERRAPSLVAPPGGDTGPPGAVARSPQPPAVAPPTSVEQDFRDGLRSLLAGDPAAAIPLLDRACQTPSASQDDSCYWAAVAWLRSGARPRARRAFAEVLTRWPGSTHISEAHIALGWLLLEIGDRPGARSHFAAAADDRLPSIRADALRGLTATQ